MTQSLKRLWPVLLLAFVLLASVAINIRPYQWNITAVFHMDERLAAERPMPKGFVILGVPSYDGAQYYQIARNMSAIVTGNWNEVSAKAPGSYAYQRFLLPLSAWILSLGHEPALPWAFVLINIAALLGTCFIVLQFHPKRPLTALALGLCPSAMVAMHFTLAEPLTILLLTAVLLRMKRDDRIDALSILLLSLVVLAREVNILLIGFLIGYSLLRLKWQDALLLIIPVLSFLALHTLIYAMFRNIPFLLSADAHEPPFHAAWVVLSGQRGYDRYTLSAIALFLCFVLPSLCWTVTELLRKRMIDLYLLGSLTFLTVMLLMPNYIWGSITSIGRVITPVYPLTLLALADRNTPIARLLTLSILALGLGTCIGLALQIHPYNIA